MYPKRIAVLLFATLVVTAGCLGGGGGDGGSGAEGADGGAGNGSGSGAGSGDGGDGDAPVNDGSDPFGSGSGSGSDGGSAGDGGVVGVPGSGNGDVPNTGGSDGALVENRTAALMAAGSYASEWKTTFTRDGVVASESVYTTAVDYANERSLFGMRMVSEGAVTTAYESFFADGTAYTRYGGAADATYLSSTGEFAPEDSMFSPELHAYTGQLAGYERVGTEQFDGVTVTRYEYTDETGWVGSGVDGQTVEWTDVTYFALVDGNGLVRAEGWTATAADDAGVVHTYEYSYSLTGIGSTAVPDPDWLGEARAQYE